MGVPLKLVQELWDGVTGATGTQFNKGAQLPWQNKGGDHFDADGVAQGAKAYAVAKPTVAARWVEFDLSALKPDAHGRVSVILRAVGSCKIETGKLNRTYRPQLVVDGAVILARAVAPLDGLNPVTTPIVNVSPSKPLSMQFDAPAGVRSVLRVYMTYKEYMALTLSVFAMRFPKVFAGGPKQLGLAAAHAVEFDPEDDPNVYFGERAFNANWGNEWSIPALENSVGTQGGFGSLGARNWAVVPDGLAPGIPALKLTFFKGDQAPCTLSHPWTAKDPRTPIYNRHGVPVHVTCLPSQYREQQHPGTPEELFFRGYWKFGPDYQCSNTGKKVGPCIAGRYGIRRGNDIRSVQEPHGGNGQSETYGDWRALLGAEQGFSGWSVRWLATQGPGDANPLKRYIRLGLYVYHMDQGSHEGNLWMLGNHTTGFLLIDPAEWAALETHVKLNDVVGPFDFNGNGTAVANGVLEAWFDGVLVFRKTNMRFRRHPAIKVDEAWIDNYHGGSTVAEAQHTLFLADLVVANQYIGPLALGLEDEEDPIVIAQLQAENAALRASLAIEKARADSLAVECETYRAEQPVLYDLLRDANQRMKDAAVSLSVGEARIPDDIGA